MNTQTVEIRVGAELPDIQLSWEDSTGATIDFSSGWTFTAWIAPANSVAAVALVTKTTGITGAATLPNITIAFGLGELAALQAGQDYEMQVRARRTSDSKDRDYPDRIVLHMVHSIG